jgi:hypothetical protein
LPIAAASTGGDVELIDLVGPVEIDARRIDRSGEALDAPVKRLVRDIDFSI